jgi:DNA-binding transcriptional ArsR family regulator
LLKEAGLVTDRAEGTRRLYRLHDDGIVAIRDYLEQLWRGALPHRGREYDGAVVNPLEVSFTVASARSR